MKTQGLCGGVFNATNRHGNEINLRLLTETSKVVHALSPLAICLADVETKWKHHRQAQKAHRVKEVCLFAKETFLKSLQKFIFPTPSQLEEWVPDRLVIHGGAIPANYFHVGLLVLLEHLTWQWNSIMKFVSCIHFHWWVD